MVCGWASLSRNHSELRLDSAGILNLSSMVDTRTSRDGEGGEAVEMPAWGCEKVCVGLCDLARYPWVSYWGLGAPPTAALASLVGYSHAPCTLSSGREGPPWVPSRA